MIDLELRPSPARRRLAYVMTAVVGAVFAIGGTIAAGVPGLLIGLAVSALMLAVMYGHLRRSRIVVTSSEIVVHGLVITRRRERSRAASVVRAVVIPVRGPAVDTVFVRAADDSRLLRIHGNNYEAEDLDRLVAHLRLPSTGPDRPVTAGQLDRAYPSLVPWVEAHPFRFSFAVAFGFVTLVVVVGIVVASL
ncbi:hypothetical protein [Jiangella asiatica]|uniref:Uncharacterized protein n=1 Tax=Jiangella asiatica TaxID=2530372 RepID=A0A4R5CNX0_9ACTN|nr:hypothetical protein [Jiangella asiatica]TDE00094.1 hypothetical protein E1269_26610 [Jiangella asiatica]